jgi:hypothetical protein
MEPDTFMRDNIINHRGVTYGATTKLQALPESVERGIRSLKVSSVEGGIHPAILRQGQCPANLSFLS